MFVQHRCYHPILSISSVETRNRYGRFLQIWKPTRTPFSIGLLSAWSGNKLYILASIKAPTARICTARQVWLMVFYMAAIIHMVRPTRAVTFAEHVSWNVAPCLDNQLMSKVEHVDAIWDIYPEKPKSLTQKRRGTGVRTRLEPNSDDSTPILKRDWRSYLVYCR